MPPRLFAPLRFACRCRGRAAALLSPHPDPSWGRCTARLLSPASFSRIFSRCRLRSPLDQRPHAPDDPPQHALFAAAVVLLGFPASGMGRAGFSPTARRLHFSSFLRLWRSRGCASGLGSLSTGFGDSSTRSLTHLPLISASSGCSQKGYLPFGGAAPGLIRGPRHPRRGPRLPLRLERGVPAAHSASRRAQESVRGESPGFNASVADSVSSA